jgi:competence protein ComEC
VPAPTAPFEGWVTALTDPEPFGSGIRLDVRSADGRHLQAEAYAGRGREELRAACAGERIHVSGRTRPSPPGSSWLTTRHVAGALAVDDVRARSPGAPWMQAANAVRDLLVHGADGLPARERPLFLGFVLGDTRGQSADITDDFRGAGLSHLLAVSGQNVAFVLALAGLVLRRVGLRVRLPATIAVIAFFALVTRFEPSVLRASAMAALAVTSTAMGRDASSLRLLALAVTGLVVFDPFLVHSVGFQLSAAACIGIVTLAPRLAAALQLPRWLGEPLSVTLAAQAGVAPVLLTTFGGVPIAGIPANVLAAPLAGPVMIWGLSAGMLAGALGSGWSAALHWPTHLMIGWIAAVAHWGALVPLGEVRAGELLAIVGGVVVVAAAASVGYVGVRRAGLVAIAVALVAPAVVLRATAPLQTVVAPGATLWRDRGSVLDLDGRTEAGSLLEGLRRAGVTSLDVVVARTATVAVRDALDAVRRRYAVGRVLLPSNTRTDVSVRAGRLSVDVHPEDGHLIVAITPVDGGSARGPPV